jgi:AraC-like DNA-binding protein
MPREHPVKYGPKFTGDLVISADSWDGPHVRPRHCGINDFRSTPPPHAMFMDAMEPHGCWEYVLSGTIYYRIAGERHRVEAGEALVTRRPDPGWMLRPVRDVPVQTIWITISGELGLRMFHFLHQKFGQIQRFPQDSEVVRMLRRYVQIAQRQPHDDALVWSERTFRWMKTWWKDAIENHPPRDRSVLNAIEPSRLISYAPGSVKNFAAAMGYSRAYLTRKLSQQWQRPPGAVLREVRLQDAASMLRSTRMSISEVAAKVGYATTASFCRAFRRQYQQAPQQYRRNELSDRRPTTHKTATK